MAQLIAITGGIGSGKSAVCRCLEAWGFRVYDCDSRAKRLMDKSEEIHRRLRQEIDEEVVADGKINRKRLAQLVFNDAELLRRLNAIVHSNVTDDLRQWRRRHDDEPLLFVETAILLESNLHREVDQVWLVDADEQVRLQRACNRDNAPAEAILARMRQQRRVTAADLPVALRIINNNPDSPIIPALQKLLAESSPLPAPRQWKN